MGLLQMLLDTFEPDETHVCMQIVHNMTGFEGVGHYHLDFTVKGFLLVRCRPLHPRTIPYIPFVLPNPQHHSMAQVKPKYHWR